MSKISDFEDKIIKYGMNENYFIEYCTLLKRIPNNFNKCQHCYITAIKFPAKYYNEAIQLIKYALENFADSWFSIYSCHYYCGRIFESSGNYKNAHASYLNSLEILGDDHQEYLQNTYGYLLWTQLHISNFQYTDELKTYYNYYSGISDFQKSFKNAELRLSIAQIVIALHENNFATAKYSYLTVFKIISPSYFGKLHQILQRHKYEETIYLTPETKKYLKSIKKMIE